MKNLQVSVEAMYNIDVPDDFDFTDIAEVQNKVEEHLESNNMTAHNEFYENMTVICGNCGVSLNLDEEKEDGCCANCGAKQNENI